MVGNTCRMNGRSYLGIVDVTKSKISLLHIPFTDINNIVIALHDVLFHLILKISKCTLELFKRTHAYMQISGHDCLYVEGASASHPLSIAKVLFSYENKDDTW